MMERKVTIGDRKPLQRLAVLALSAVLFACSPSGQDKGEQPVEAVVTHATQAQIDSLAASLDVQYTVLDNRAKDACGEGAWRCFSARIDLTTDQDFQASGWALYYSQLFPVKKVESAEFTVEIINGDLNRITPAAGYEGFKAGETKSLVLHIAGAHGNEFWPMPNYYVAAEGLKARTVKSTIPVPIAETRLESMPHLTGFTDPEKQFRITDQEKIEWATAGVLYAANKNTMIDGSSVKTAIIPTPREIDIPDNAGHLDLSRGITLEMAGADRADIDAALARLALFGVRESESGVPLQIDVSARGKFSPGGYSLEISKNSIAVRASDAAGAFYALQSLAGLISLDEQAVPQMTVRDSPRYPFRGLHLDVARNFHSKELVLKLLDQMAAYKLNKFHFHLGDDEGWRLEIPGLPELTSIGARRCHDPSEATCILPQLGSGPAGEGAVNGYYTVEDYAEILAAASARHIEVIPSFDMPGHSRAAVKSMEARYRRLVAEGKPEEAVQYLLTDFDDSTLYSSIQNYTDNTINVCLESSFTFVGKVIDELISMHVEAGIPLNRYHIGADETAGAWKDSPACAAFLADNPHDVASVNRLGPYFIERVSNMLASKGIQPAGWGDGLGHTDPEKMPARVQSNAWGRLVDPAHPAAHRDINRGWDVVLSIPDVSYFDFPYEADPKERGYDWAARRLNTRKVFEFMPDNLPAHAEVWTDQEGLPLYLDDRRKTDNEGKVLQEPIERGKGITGIQAQIWSETLRADDHVEYMAFPRLLALAERAWHVASWEVPYDNEGGEFNQQTKNFTADHRRQRNAEWNGFSNILAGKELAKLDLVGVAYRIPTVGAKIIDGKLHCNVIFPGLTIEYRENGGGWTVYQEPVEISEGVIEVRALSANGVRKGRALIVQ